MRLVRSEVLRWRHSDPDFLIDRPTGAGGFSAVCRGGTDARFSAEIA
jgi:hypothetical protein